ncbi:hypothetical protein ACJX0J_013202, partial [Zea mays]
KYIITQRSSALVTHEFWAVEYVEELKTIGDIWIKVHDNSSDLSLQKYQTFGLEIFVGYFEEDFGENIDHYILFGTLVLGYPSLYTVARGTLVSGFINGQRQWDILSLDCQSSTRIYLLAHIKFFGNYSAV